ncbi:unnamed protein product [Chrysoparadoxa australica]
MDKAKEIAAKLSSSLPVAEAEIAAKLSSSLPVAEATGGKRDREEEEGGSASYGANSKKRSRLEIPTDGNNNIKGVLIGPRGAALKQLQNKSGARICIRGGDGTDSLHAVIEGSEKAVEAATTLLNSIIQDPAEANRIKQQQLQDLAAVKAGQVPQAYGGGYSYPPAGVHHLHYPSHGMPMASPYAPGAPIYGAPGAAGTYAVPTAVPTAGGSYAGAGAGTGSEVQMCFPVPDSVVGVIIGKGGESLKRLQATHGVAVKIAKAEEGKEDREMTIKGLESNVAAARAQVDAVINGKRALQQDGKGAGAPYSSESGAVTLSMKLPDDKIGLIIGQKGANLKGFQSRNNCTIQIPPEPDADDPKSRTITVSATSQESAERCVGEINTVLAAGPGGGLALGAMPGQTQVHTQIPNDKVGLIIGKGGASIKDLQARTGARVHIPAAADPATNMRSLVITGRPEHCAAAKYEIDMLCGGGVVDPYASLDSNIDPYQQQPQQQQPGAQAYGWAGYQQQQQQGYAQPGMAQSHAPATGGVDLAQYHEDFWQYAAYYGEKVAREQYTVWAPPVGTPPPAHITLPAPAPGHEHAVQ